MQLNCILKMKKTIYICMVILFFSPVLAARTVEFPLLQSLAYVPYSESKPLEKGKLSFTLDSSYSNVYRFNGDRSILNDFEVFSNIIGFRYGMTENDTIEVYYRHYSILGGALDKLIEDFHDTFNLPDNQRGEYPRNSVNYRYKNYFTYNRGVSGSSHIVLAYFKSIDVSPYIRFGGRLGVGIPLSDKAGLSSGKPFLSAGLNASYEKGKFSIEASQYWSFFKKPSWLQGEDIRSSFSVSRIELNVFRGIAGFNFSTSPFKLDKVSHRAYQVYVGYRILKNLDFIILEDFLPFDTTPDLSFNMRVKFLIH